MHMYVYICIYKYVLNIYRYIYEHMWYMYSNTHNIHKIYVMAYIYLCSKYYADSIIYIYIYLTYIYIYIYILH